MVPQYHKRISFYAQPVINPYFVIDLGGNDLDDLDIDEIMCEMLLALLHNIREVNNMCVIMHTIELSLKGTETYNHQVDS